MTRIKNCLENSVIYSSIIEVDLSKENSCQGAGATDMLRLYHYNFKIFETKS